MIIFKYQEWQTDCNTHIKRKQHARSFQRVLGKKKNQGRFEVGCACNAILLHRDKKTYDNLLFMQDK